MPDKIFIEQLEVTCVIGIFDWERKIRQKVRIDLEMPCDAARAARKDEIGHTVDYKSVAKRTIGFVSASRFQLIETLAERLAALILSEFKISRIRLRISKPGAVRGSKNVGVEIIRNAPRKKKNR